MASDTLTIVDNRTGKKYELPIADGTVRAIDLRQIKSDGNDFGLMTYDPAFMNTAACRSAITFIDGNLKSLLDAFRYNAHPMGKLISTLAALGTFYPEAKNIFDPPTRQKQITRLVAKMITIAAFGYRHMMGQPYAYPDNDLSYPGNFLNMMYKTTEVKYQPNAVLEHALDVLFILHADHEQNCSTNAMRAVGSSHVDPYSAVAAAAAALYGPLHGGANEEVIRMLTEIGSINNIPAFIQRVKGGEGVRLMGFGHRVYKNYDPRAKIIKKVAYDVFEVT